MSTKRFIAELPVQNNPGTAENNERSGDRNELSLSNAVRSIPNVRNFDLDMYQVAPSGPKNSLGTKKFEIFFEATSSRKYDAELKCYNTRVLAKAMQAYTFCIFHAYNDGANKKPIELHVWDHTGKKIVDGKITTWDVMTSLCTKVHEHYVAQGYSKDA